jgi:monooxygenase
MSYKGMMIDRVPNLAFSMGYINQSWTLKAELTCEHVCRLLAYMDRRGYRRCMPRNDDPSVTPAPLLDLASGYVQRSVDRFPKQGSRAPWRAYQNYLLDIPSQRWARVDHPALRFSA